MPPSREDLRFQREIDKFAAATRGLITPKPCTIFPDLQILILNTRGMANASRPAAACAPASAPPTSLAGNLSTEPAS